MKVPLLDLKAQLKPLENEIKDAVCEVVSSTRYIMGPKVEELESQIAEYCGVGSGVGVSSGTDALLVSLMALEVGHDDLVLTTPYSFFATAGAVARVGAKPVFVDIDPGTYNLDPEALKEWFSNNQDKVSKVKAIIAVHLYGQCADIEAIVKIADEYGIPVIEDAAQAIGAKYPTEGGKKKAGSFGALGCFSFFPSKNLGGVGDGGMVVSKDEKLAEKVRLLRNHGAKPKYYHSLIGGNFRLDPIQAAVILVKLPHLDSWHQARQENAHFYDEVINTSGVVKPNIAYDRECHIYNQYVISVPEKRDDFREFLKSKDIGHEVYYPVSFHEQECFSYLGYKLGDFPKSEQAARSTVALPIYPELTREMQEYVVAAIEEFYG